MKQEILDRITALGGYTGQVTGVSLQADLAAIELKTPLYPKPRDTPWARAEETEPIEGLGEYMQEALTGADTRAVLEHTLDLYFSADAPSGGQAFFRPQLFTPFRKEASDFAAWTGVISETAVRKMIPADPLDFMQIAWSSGYPDVYFICLSDKNPDNPTVYSTDHEVFFTEIEEEGNLETFFNSFFTRDELAVEIRRVVCK
ncbi:hypothetical protein [Niabella beijingensis]|uniref:hypothetical protein n=1 Tax=Niabella beijingensis TaxID=2872700 RepID=UPI001CBA8D5D|nr:hypothetical protein [Niabella beijingensis]MBZ4192672.1 hypothetical protein [Niabella beijingensis]